MRRRVPEHERLLGVLQRMLETPVADLRGGLEHAANLIADALGADKVDAFLYDPSRESLVAVGTSTQPLSAKERKHGLDLLQIANGGRVVWVWQHGETFMTGRLHEDATELAGIRDVLAIKSKLGVPILVGADKRGVLMIASLQPDYFTPDDARFAESVARWVGLVVHRAELVEEMSRNAVEQGRRAVAQELVTALAHDFKNLLTPVHVRVDMIRRRASTEPDRGDAEAALRSVNRLNRLVVDLLDVARLDQGLFELDLQPVHLPSLVEETVRALSRPGAEISVLILDDVHVRADASRTRQCIENLLANAIQHSPKGAPITVEISLLPGQPCDLAKVEVRDEGPGIPPEILGRVFDRFVGRTGGLGLGLYLARRIAVAHQGDLTVVSEPGRGARFTFTLPVCE
jgi:two-component system, OmpR family, sensor kinase